jgi:hypothetical protein
MFLNIGQNPLEFYKLVVEFMQYFLKKHAKVF